VLFVSQHMAAVESQHARNSAVLRPFWMGRMEVYTVHLKGK
jgi:hypothetical protein